MHRIFESEGILKAVTGFDGKPIKQNIVSDVYVDVKYQLSQSPIQSLILDVYGYQLISGGGDWSDELSLKNGLVFRGNLASMKFRGNEDFEIHKTQFINIEQDFIYLDSDNKPSDPIDLEIDSIIFPLLSSEPLGHGACSVGVARPGFPFSNRTRFPETKGHWSTHALRLSYRDLDIFLSSTSNYWCGLVDTSKFTHDSIVGIRKRDKKLMTWNEIERVVSLLEQFVGWINHCISPVFHIKAYRKGRLVCRSYKVRPLVTNGRDRDSWLPKFINDNIDVSYVSHLFNLFVKKWEQNERNKGIFHTVLGLLKNEQKGSALTRPSLGYLRDTFTACSILESMLNEKKPLRGRSSQIESCLKHLRIPNILPYLTKDDYENIIEKYPQLWWSNREKKILKNRIGNLSQALANLDNWILHLEDNDNVERLFALPEYVRDYLLDISMWLADLLILKLIEYEGGYFNRLTQQTEIVPWASID